MEGLGPYIRELREKLDISLREFAKKLKRSAAFVSDIELGKRHPSDEVLADIASALGVSVDDLRAHDIRAPIQGIKDITQTDPKYALAFRTVIDRNISADALLEFVQQSQSRGRRTKPKG